MKQKRKQVKSKRNNKKRQEKVLKSKDPFPKSVTVTLKYTHVRMFGSASLSFIYNAYNFNSAYDPDYSGVGSQPLGYDQWSAMYTKYFIDKATIEVIATNTTVRPVIFGIIPQLDDSLQTDVQAAISNPMCKWVVLGPAGGASVCQKIKNTCTIQTLYANKNINSSQDEYTGNSGNVGTGSSPLRNGFFHVFYSTISGDVLGANAIHYVMNLHQNTEFCRRNDIAQS